MNKNIAALAEELKEHLSERKLLLTLIVVPAFVAGFMGATFGGIVSGHAMDKRIRDQIARAEATHARFEMADVTLQQGPGRLGQMIVIPKTNRTIIGRIVCPPHITNGSTCFTIERTINGGDE